MSPLFRAGPFDSGLPMPHSKGLADRTRFPAPAAHGDHQSIEFPPKNQTPCNQIVPFP
jgi:hypothetical protein